MRKLLLIAGMLTLVIHANAQDSGVSETAPTRERMMKPTGWEGFAEISAGYTANNDNIKVEGSPASIKLLGSYYLDNHMGVFDLGIGAHTQSFIEDNVKDDTISTTVLEAAARYQFENRWQLGVVYNQFFDRGDNYFSNQADALFGGIQVLKEITVGDKNELRIGLRAMTDLNTDDEDVNIAQLDLAFGFGQGY